MLHIPVAAHVRRKWDDMNKGRMKQSTKRRTEAYRIKHALGKQKRRKKKQEDKVTYDAEQKAAKKAASTIDKQPAQVYSSGGKGTKSARWGQKATPKPKGKPKGKGKAAAPPRMCPFCELRQLKPRCRKCDNCKDLD